MSSRILHNSAVILLVGAGPASQNMVTKGFSRADSVVAVDGGCESILSAGGWPDVLIGDLDSVGDIPDGVPVHRVEDQNTTDLQKALGATQADIYIGVGFLGGRLDHQLAALSAIMTDPRPIILIDDSQLVFHCPPHLELDLPDGCPVALYPMATVRVEAQGLRYNIKDAAMSPDGLISTSNSAVGGRVAVWRTGAGLMVTLPADELDTVIAALRG